MLSAVPSVYPSHGRWLRHFRTLWTDAVASVETYATQTEVDWRCGECGDQRNTDRSGLTLWRVWRPTRHRQKWTDTVASVETNATQTEVDWHCGECGDQRNTDRSGLTLWRVWRPTRHRQKWTDTVASVETSTETEGETETRPSSLFSRGRPRGEYTANRKETIVNQNVERFTHAVPHVSSIRLDLNTLRLGLCQRLAAVLAATLFVEWLSNYCLSLETFSGTVNNNYEKKLNNNYKKREKS